MQSMFNLCTNLTILDLSYFNAEKVTTMRGMFNEYYKLKNVNLSSLNIHKVVDMSWIFYGCKELINKFI